jgi:hypothetical protein
MNDSLHRLQPHSTLPLGGFALGLALLVAVLASWNWVLVPNQALRWLRGMLVLPALWVGLTVYRQWMLRSLRNRGRDDEAAVRRYFDSAILLVFVALGVPQVIGYVLALGIALGGPERGDLGRRVSGLIASVVIVAIGNALPKILTPLSILPPGGAVRQQAARRFVGLSFVLMGLTLATAFLFAPIEFAAAFRRWIAAAGFLVTAGAIVWMNMGPAHREGSR